MAILDDRTLDFVSSGVEQTIRLGVRLGELLQPRDVVGLAGELGAGKTVMARGIGRGWGTPLRVTSPSYVLVNEYPRISDGAVLYHLDCYRLTRSEEVITAGLEDILDSNGAVIIEWPENLEAWLPADRLWVTLRYQTATRRGVRYTASGERSEELLKRFRLSAFGY